MLRDIPRLGPRISDDDSIFMNGITGNDHGHHDDIPHQNSLDPLDDVFGSAPSSPILTGDNSQIRPGAARAEHSDVPRLRSIHVTNGYREGIAVSKEQFIQAGFDEGYSLGGEIGTKVGWCLGVLEGVYAAARKAARSSQGAEGGQALLRSVRDVYEHAQDELKAEKLLSPQYFGPDGIWLFDVPGQDASDDELQVTFKDVAAAHPVLVKWVGKIAELGEELGVCFS